MSSLYQFPPKRVLVPTDLGDASESALKYARYLHETFGTQVRVLHAHYFELPPYFSSGQLKDLKRELKRLGEAAVKYVRKKSEPLLGYSPDIRVVESAPAEAILEAAKANDLDLVVMGMHGRRGMERIWMGSVTERIIRQSNIPVLAVRRPPPDTPIQHILCPMSPTDTGRQALAYAADISRMVKATLTILHVVERGDEPLACPLVGEEVKNSCRVEEVNLRGSAARTILESAASLKPDLIVMGMERKQTLMGEFFSSTTSSVMQLAAAPLLVVPKTTMKEQ